MPKTSYTTKRKAYVPRRRTYGGATIRKPYGGNRYGNDAFVKVEAIEPLANALGTANVFSTMRVNAPVVAGGNTYLGNQAEFQAF